MAADVASPDLPLTLACPNCGAQRAYAAEAQALRCSYCASVTEIPRPADSPAGGAVDAIVPLGVSEEALLDAVHAHLITGTLTPDDLLLRATFVQKERLYVPAFEFSGSYEARWTASFGYDRTEHYTVYESRTENGRTRQVPVTKTRIITDWRPASGQDEGRFAVRTYAGQRLHATDAQVLAMAEDHSLGKPVPFASAYTLAVDQEAFAQTAEAAYTSRGQAQVNAQVDEGVARHGQGDRQRDWHWTAQIRKQHRRLLVPVCQVVYEYDGRRYHFWCSGVDTARWVADPLPVDSRRSRALAWSLAPMAIAVVAAPMAIKALNESAATSIWPVFALVMAGAFAAWRYRCIVGPSLKRRQALLAARRGGAPDTAEVTASRFTSLTSGRAALVTTCVLAGLLPALPFVEMPDASTPPEHPTPTPSATTAWRPPPEPALARPLPVAPTAPAAGTHQVPDTAAAAAQPEPEAPRTPTQDVASVLVAAAAMDWAAVDARLARLKAHSREHTADEVERLNDAARRHLRRDNPEQAAQALVQVLALKPESPTAWSNLTEALTSPDAARAALRVAIRLSTHREKTVQYLRRVQVDMAGEPFARLAQQALEEIDQIPLHAKDPGPARTDQVRGGMPAGH